MKVLRKSSEEEMLIEFLRAEYSSERFSEQIRDAITKLQYDEKIIISPDIHSTAENLQRKRLMGEFRGYGLNRELFENFPAVTGWNLCSFTGEDLGKIQYINYSYWNELSDNTRSPLTAAKNILNGKTVFGESNDAFIRASRYLKRGGKFPKMYFLTCDYKRFVIVEGHLRMTAYALAPECFIDAEAIVGKSGSTELREWM